MKKIPKKGGWVMVKELIPTQQPVHTLCIYYAIPTGVYLPGPMVDSHPERNYGNILKYFGKRQRANAAVFNFLNGMKSALCEEDLDELNSYDRPSLEAFDIGQQVKIITEYGQILLQPWEYSIASEKIRETYLKAVKSGHAFMQFISESEQLKGKVSEQVFYLQSRGIRFQDAITMCLGEVKSPHMFYIRMHPAYIHEFFRCPSAYFRNHLKHLRNADLTDQYNKYLQQIRQIEGFENFQEQPNPKSCLKN